MFIITHRKQTTYNAQNSHIKTEVNLLMKNVDLHIGKLKTAFLLYSQSTNICRPTLRYINVHLKGSDV